ncbi:MAG TPA: carboxypeptidase regulatory-like domain-containing protein [Bryobacteraceae bacterium]|nr:carboxypeptidase regulatory-like domain-containing protein [Bryobacteraceae bacterium]
MRLLSAYNVAFFAFCAATGVAPISAQETINYASMSGRVTDATGAVIRGAQVSARQTETNQTSTAATDREGRFRFPFLKLGPYEITFHQPGFTDVTRPVTLTVGSAFELPVTLAVSSIGTAITVTGDATVLEGARSQIAGTVPNNEIQELPLNGRNFLDAALLIPGVSPTNTASNQLFAETAAVPGQGISIGSQRNFSNGFIVDGLSDNDDAAGLTGAFYGLDVVGELQVVTSGGQAEFGRALGGYVNVVTKSGTNELHGDLYGFFRNSRFNAANALSNTVLPMTQAQYGASLGGPIIRDRTFYFANFEQRELNQSGLVTISPTNVATINARLLAIGYPGAQIYTGIYPNPVHSTNFLGKVDHQFSSKDQFSARYSLYHVTSINSRGAGGLSAPSASANLYDTDQVIAVSNIVALSPRAVNETRGQFWNSNLQAPPSDEIGPAVSISGVASFGTLSGSPTGRLNKLGEAVDSFSYETGAHAIRVGTEFLYNDDTITFPRSNRGSYSFSSLANFLKGTYNTSGFTQTFANSVIHQTNPNVGFYAQDEWKVNTHLTLNLGMRYDLQFLQSIATDTNNVSPRGGFAWTPFASRKTVIRGGYGLFYDRVPLRALANALLSANNTTNPADLSQISVSLSPTQAGAPEFPNILGSLTLPPGVLFNFSTMYPHMQNAYSEQGSFEIEQELGGRSTVSAGYQHVRGLHLIISVNQNVPNCTASGTNNGCRPNPNYGNDSQYSSLADSHYDAFYVSFVQRPVRWGNYRISYTYSKALDDVGEFFFSAPINNFNIWQDYGRSDDDQRHRFVFDGSVHTPMGAANSAWERISHGFQLTSMLQYYSPLPFNITTGANTIQGTAARPTINGGFINRNAGSGFDFFSLGARLSRSFQLTERLRLEALAEGFNLTNHVNGVSLNGTFGTGVFPTNPLPTFEQITAVADPRSFQFAMRFTF